MANRGEIASRVFRAATELGFRTVAIYAPEDRLAIHRFKAGEASLVGACKGPVGAYLDSPGIITLAQEKGVQQIPAQVGETVESKDLPMKLRQA